MSYHLWFHQTKLRMSKIRFISESGRSISDIMDVSERWNIDALVTIDNENAFDYINHSLSVAVLKAFGLGRAFLH